MTTVNISSMGRRWFGGLMLGVAAVCAAPGVSLAAPSQAPDKFIEELSNTMLQQIKDDPKVKSGDLGQINKLVESTLMPKVDFQRMTALSVGRPWREATPDQKEKLMAEYKQLLIRTYSGAFRAVKDQSIRMRPFRDAVAEDNVLVRSEIVRPGGDPIQLDYRLEQADNEWKIYDVNVLGVWLVQTYRNQFGQEINANGIDGLIKSLAEKNKAGAN